MKYSFVAVFMITTMMIGCSQSANPLSSTSGTLAITLDGLKPYYTPGDTLAASVDAYNFGKAPDTLVAGAGRFDWSLEDENGHVVMMGGIPYNLVWPVAVDPGQTKEVYAIRHSLSVTDSGIYTLRVLVRPYGADSIRFSPTLSVR